MASVYPYGAVFFEAAADPTSADDAATIGAKKGHLWRNSATGAIFLGADPTTGVAVWARIDTVYATPAELISAVLTVDGAGSGLDADLLDGQQGSAYLAFGNFTGTLSDAQHGNRGGGALHAVATVSVAGFMSAADKTKLDGIEAGATADQTAAEILAALLTVDGAGSGLDADTIDGVNSASLVQTSRQVASGAGLTGGGDLSTDRTLALTGQALALHNLGSSGLVARTGAGTVAARTITAPAAGITVGDGNGVAGNPTLALADDLAAVEGISGTGTVERTAPDTWGTYTVTTAAKTVLDDATAEAMRLTLGVDFGQSGGAEVWESGNWTPAVSGASTPGTYTLGTALGRYARVGDLVFAAFDIDVTATPVAGTGNLQITGLPFASGNFGMTQGGALSEVNNVTLAAGYTGLGCRVNNNAATINLLRSGSAVAAAVITCADLGATCRFRGSIVYRRA